MLNGIAKPYLALKGLLTSPYGGTAPAITVTCDDPDDITPVIDALTKRVEDIKSADAKAKIIVWAGEWHTMPSSKIIQPALTDRLITQNIPTVKAFEAARNYGIDCADEYFDISIPRDAADEFLARDKNGEIHRHMMTGFHNQRMAPLTIEAINQFYSEGDVRTAFTDAARWYGSDTLDFEDPLTRQSFTAMNETNFEFKEEVVHPIFMELRNRVMLESAVTLTEDTDVVVQMCGMYHVFGSGRQYLYRESLAGLFHEKSKDMPHVHDIKLFIGSGHTTLPEMPDARSCGNTIFVEGLNGRHFSGEYGRDGQEEEVAFIRSLKGAPKFFQDYSVMSRESRHENGRAISSFLQGWCDHEEKAGTRRVRNRRPAVF